MRGAMITSRSGPLKGVELAIETPLKAPVEDSQVRTALLLDIIEVTPSALGDLQMSP